MAWGTPINLGNTVTGVSTQNTLVITTLTTINIGELVVVFGGTNVAVLSLTGVTDSGGNSYSVIAGSQSTPSMAMAWCVATAQVSAGGHITVTFNGGNWRRATTAFKCLALTAISLDAVAPATAAGTTNVLSIATGALTAQPSLVIACRNSQGDPGLFVNTSGFTQVGGSTAGMFLQPFTKLVPSLASVNASLTWTNSVASRMMVRAFDAPDAVQTITHAVVSLSPILPPSPTPTTLGGLAANKAKLFGTLLYYANKGSAAGTKGQISTDPVYKAAEAVESNWYVADNDCAMSHIKPNSQAAYDFRLADGSINYAQGNGMSWRAGPFIYDKGTFYLPSYWDSLGASAARTELLNFITATVSRYRGRVQSWQIINEVLVLASAGGITSDGYANMRNGRVVAKLGAGFYEDAFAAAHAADPNAILYVNDNTLENNNSSTSVPRRAAYLTFLDRMINTRGVPVTGMGIQAHIGTVNSNTNDSTLSAFLDDLASLGLKVLITEMDVNDTALPADFPTRDAGVAEAYRRFLNVVYPHTACVGVSTWQMNDAESWLQTFDPRADGLPKRPLPLDSGYAKKPAYTAIGDAIALIPDVPA